MNAYHPGASVEGVGVAYHPFLHDSILRSRDAVGFVELPMDCYADPAQSALTDPGDARLQEIAAAFRCTWRGSVLSLGSAVPRGEAGFSPSLIRRMRQLLTLTGAASYTDAIGFRRLGGCDLGHAQGLPTSEAAAAWVAARQDEASALLGVNITLAPVRSRVTPPAGPLRVGDFLQRIAGGCGAQFALEAGWLAEHPDVALGGRVAMMTLAAQDEAAWAELPALAARAAPRSIVVRRDQALFSGLSLAQDAARAAACLAPRRDGAAPEALAALHAYQSAFVGYFGGDAAGPVPPELGHIPDASRIALAGELQHWRNWRKQMDDAHKTQQIAAFLTRDGANAGGRPQ